MSRVGTFRYGLSFLGGLTLVALVAAPAFAQAPALPADPNPGNLTITGSFDAVSTYMFRGIGQHSTGIALWPVADLGLAAYSEDGGLKSVAINLGTWNSLHAGDTGVDGPTGKPSSSRVTGSVGFGFSY